MVSVTTSTTATAANNGVPVTNLPTTGFSPASVNIVGTANVSGRERAVLIKGVNLAAFNLTVAKDGNVQSSTVEIVNFTTNLSVVTSGNTVNIVAVPDTAEISATSVTLDNKITSAVSSINSRIDNTSATLNNRITSVNNNDFAALAAFVQASVVPNDVLVKFTTPVDIVTQIGSENNFGSAGIQTGAPVTITFYQGSGVSVSELGTMVFSSPNTNASVNFSTSVTVSSGKSIEARSSVIGGSFGDFNFTLNTRKI